MNSLDIAERAARLVEFLQRDEKRRSFEYEGDREYDIIHCRIGDVRRHANVRDALVDRDTGAEREDQQRDDEAPEVKLASIAERMIFVAWLVGAVDPIQQEKLVRRV